jgi:hypothetical protein
VTIVVTLSRVCTKKSNLIICNPPLCY